MWRLPGLAVMRAHSPITVPRPGASGVEVWRDSDGAVCAYGYARGAKLCMHFPGLAEFHFTPASATVRAVAAPGARLEAVHDTCRRSVLPMALATRGLEVLHASAVRTSRGIVAFCGESGTGKSTIAFALSCRGPRLWADDAVALDLSGPGCFVVPLPFSIRLRRQSAGYFRVAADIRHRTPCEPAPLTALCVLRRGIRGTAAARLSPAEAFSALLAHAYCFTLRHAEHKRRMIEHYLRLSAMTPVFEVRFQAGLHHLSTILDTIERAIDRL